ncbi:MAG: hypothetical protein LW870_15050 [Pirellula sp.]|nr:hypothetical protein [Pirellula sp.]
MKALFMLLVFAFTEACVLLAGDLEKEARSKAEQFISTSKYALENYLMQVDLVVETTADSELLIDSVGRMVCFVDRNRIVTKVSWTPTILDDLRTGRSRDASLTFSSHDQVIEFCRGESRFIFVGDRPTALGEKSSPYFSTISAVVFPFDWPLISFDSFRRDGSRGLSKILFEKKICFHALEKNGILESYWTVPDKSQAYIKVCFKEDLVVSKEIFWMPKKTKIEEIVVESQGHDKFETVKTKWTKFEGVEVPSEIIAIFPKSPINKSTIYQLKANLKFSNSNSPEFRDFGKEADRLDFATKQPIGSPF